MDIDNQKINKAKEILTWFFEKQSIYNPLLFCKLLNNISNSLSIVIDSENNKFKNITNLRLKLNEYLKYIKETKKTFFINEDQIKKYLELTKQLYLYFGKKEMDKETKIIKWYSENIGIIRVKNPILKKRIKDNQDKTAYIYDELASISFNPNDYQYNPFDFGIIQYTQEECIKRLDKIGQYKDFIVTYGIVCIFGKLVFQKVSCFQNN